ncbi:MAG: MucB/RseB C-terminal domain-containing protein [Burkholderiales bacterium]|nr:MucB/RseB C-terminal domain-containing protein [Burkholderiales bacterium]
MRSVAVALAAGAALFAGAAHAQSDPEAPHWLQRIYSASEHLSYTGVFVYQHGDRVETSRITRIVDPTGVRERVEVLDGTPREIIRVNDEVKCYLPGSMTVKVDRQTSLKPFRLRIENVSSIAEQYSMRIAGIERVAGHDCQVLVLEPKDNLRYGHKLWADVSTGFLIRAKAFNERGETVEHFSFTQLQIGGRLDKELLRPRFNTDGGGWRIENQDAAEMSLADHGWALRSLPPGFSTVTELKRDLGGGHETTHVVVSDGLAAVSVFIEPLAVKGRSPRAGASRQGAMNIYSRTLDRFVVTAVGEVPAEGVRRIADGVERLVPR